VIYSADTVIMRLFKRCGKTINETVGCFQATFSCKLLIWMLLRSR
jgi:hypothetical protein